MPRDLPGLYWDDERGRYFPVSSRLAQASRTQAIPPPRANLTNNKPGRPRKRRRLLGHLTGCMTTVDSRVGLTHASLHRSMHETMTYSMLSLSQGKVVSYGDFQFSSLHVTAEPDGSLCASTGDTGGWLHTYRSHSNGIIYSSSRELYLGSTVTAVCRSPTHRLVVSFGPSSRIAVQNTAQDAELWTIMSMPDTCYDIRAAHLTGSSLVLGASRKGILFPDIDASWHYEILPTGSDVFSITQQGPLVFTGTRSGSIKTFDRRLDSQQKAQDLFGGRYTDGSRTITHLSVLHDWQLLVSTISGDLELHDLRFARKDAPLMQLSGHVNTYIADLGVTVTPCGDYVFAAGQDRRIRAWSLRTGDILSPPQSSLRNTNAYDDDFSELFRQQFPDSVVAMQVTEGEEGDSAAGQGLSLLALSGKKVYRYWLGQRRDVMVR